jgi:hypothetical protein
MGAFLRSIKFRFLYVTMQCTVDNILRIENNLLKAEAEEGPKGPPAMLVTLMYDTFMCINEVVYGDRL